MISSSKEEDEADVPSEELTNGVISIYSIHKAKGLKFPIVIIPHCDMMINRKSIKPNIILQRLNKIEYKLGVNSEFIIRNFRCTDKDYDILLKDNMKEQMEEELRILCVAMTRAEHMIILSNNKSYEQIKNTLHGSITSWTRWLLETGQFNSIE